jgi:hypothetical protein
VSRAGDWCADDIAFFSDHVDPLELLEH